ncbi:DUF4157 domain-containing protein [Cellulomonas sp. SG140]|uniref:eCIS core domain-containing protein n=1 Tax=Cellulomonas sp. SG140 TaxID=2976536 RepID=UPI0021E88E2D|nr:DUF4157 domain-containing protein [Cellulomonas sp. SG140]
MPAENERTTLEKRRLTAAPPAVGPATAAATEVAQDDAVDPVAVPGLAVDVRRRAATQDPLGGTAAAPEVADVLRRRQGQGRPLEPEVAQRMGAAMDADLRGVRIHDDAEADTIARSVQSVAFTAGSDVYFSRGTYAPGTPGGDRLLGHELAHVVQQHSGRVAPAGDGPVIGRADDPAEAAADAVAERTVQRLQRQAARVATTSTADAEQAGTTTTAGAGALRRQQARVEATTVRRWNPFKKLFGGKKKKAPTLPQTPLPEALTPPVPTPEQPVPLPVPQGGELPVPTPESVTPESVTPESVTPQTAPQTAPQTPTETAPQTPTQDQTPSQTPTTQTPTTQTPTPEAVTPPTPKSAKERFEEACDPQTAPAGKAQAKVRMDALRQLINTFSTAEKKSIADDPAAMAKGRAHLGDLYYMSLLAAVNMAKQKTKKDGTKVKHHLTGAEADEFIRTNIEDYPHIKPFIATAVAAGKKGEGYVASISPEDWAIVYGVEFPTDSVAEEQSTNAYASTKNADEPAILHADRGTPSTAIHESMHRYAPNDVLDTFGFDLNEGITEYFTRMLTTKNATPTKDGGPERNNYQDNVTFVREMVRILGASKVDQETVLGEIYFEGKTEKLEASFRAAWKAKKPKMSTGTLDSKWTKFKDAISDGKWSDAKKAMPSA